MMVMAPQTPAPRSAIPCTCGREGEYADHAPACPVFLIAAAVVALDAARARADRAEREAERLRGWVAWAAEAFRRGGWVLTASELRHGALSTRARPKAR